MTQIPNGILIPVGFALAAGSFLLAIRFDRVEHGLAASPISIVFLGVACSVPFVMLLGWKFLNLWNAGLL